MNTLTMTGFVPAMACASMQNLTEMSGPRELTEAEIEQVSGGLPFVIAPILIKGAGLAAGAFIGGFFGHFGYKVASSIWGEEESSSR